MSHVQRVKAYIVRIPRPSKHVTVVVIAVVAALGVTVGASAAVRAVTGERAYAEVRVFGVDIGGLDRLAAEEKIRAVYDAMLDGGLAVTVDGETQTIPLYAGGAGGDVAYALIDLDVSAAAAKGINLGREGNWLTRTWGPLLLSTVLPINVTTPSITVREDALKDAIRATFPDAELESTPTDFSVVDEDGEWLVEVAPGIDGRALDFVRAFPELKNDAEDLQLAVLPINIEPLPSDVSAEQAAELTDEAKAALNAAPYTLAFAPEDEDAQTWEVAADTLAQWLIPVRNEERKIVLGLAPAEDDELMTSIHDTVDISAQNARFTIEDGRVVEFAGSHDGRMVSDDDTLNNLAAFLGTEKAEIPLVVDVTEPTVTTANVNNLGISEVLGVGISNFKGSPRNRIANIKHGAGKLNGLLIAPGETMSLLEQLRPFTVEDGYLPELVIKGDEIKPEVGGGLCQIGTTTFRAVMNSGLEVVERRNHSLVVSYYNDPSNGNPGTDATIYDPAPDFKFTNDTANYILLTTEVDESISELRFTFWGTDDGRQGSYTPPVILKWTGYGETITTETDTLAPGETKCQSPHPGASTTFTYNITYQDGTTKATEFTSSYRSLPTICLVGKAVEETPTEETTDGTTTETPPAEETPVTAEEVPTT